MEPLKVFIVEDDPWYGEILAYKIGQNPDNVVERFVNANSFLKKLYLRPDVVTLDFSLPDKDGASVLKAIKESYPETEVIVISGQEDVATAVKLLKLGAFDYITKDDETSERLWKSIMNVREKMKLKQKVEKLQEEVERKYEFEKAIKGQSSAIKQVFNLMTKAARTNITVSIKGETGTGKELVAKGIHYNSDRQKKPFVPVNMAAIPKDLLESELFGHEKGSFTGAVSRRIGKFEEANKGTLFLDEIAEMDLNLQSKLLRVLQERELVRVGGNESVKLDVRLVVATHRDLLEEVGKGNFREDLYYRIFGFPIELPPLRKRGADVLLLAKHFLEEFCKENKLKVKQFSEQAKQKLQQYYWPGNIRELKAVIEFAAVLADGEKIEQEDIPLNNTPPGNQAEFVEKPLRLYEIEIIDHFLQKYNDNVFDVAMKLEISKSKIYQMLKSGEIKR